MKQVQRGAAIRGDLIAGITVALVAIPQCMAFATIAGLPPASGLYAAFVMGLVGALISATPKLNLGPAVTTSSLVYAVLATTGATTELWPALAGLLAMAVGALTLLAGLLKVGRLARFVSRSVVVGLVAGAAMLIFGSQLAPLLGVAAANDPRATLIGILLSTIEHVGDTRLLAAGVGVITLLLVLLGGRFVPRVPMPFVALALAGLAVWGLARAGRGDELERIGSISRALPSGLTPWVAGPYGTDFLVGAAAIAAIGIIQTLAIAKALAQREGTRLHAKRELIALGSANLCCGLWHGFPGAGSFARSALNDVAGARTRLAGVSAAAALAAIVLLAAPLARYIPKAAIAGLLMATAWSIVDWRELRQLVLRGGDDRIVLVTTLLCVLIVPIHWAVMLGLMVSVVLFLRRVSRLHLVEMVGGSPDQFHEHDIDEQTGRSVITLLQVEGPLFFAHADPFAAVLRRVLERGPRVTILRMRRTQQVDYSVIAAMEPVVAEYLAAGGTLIICGLVPALHSRLADSALGRVLPSEHLIETTRRVFGSAHKAMTLAEGIVGEASDPDRPRLRTTEPSRAREEAVRGDTGDAPTRHS